MRALLLVPLLLLAAPALAQEDKDAQPSVEAEARDAWIRARVEELLSRDPAKKAEALKQLCEADPAKLCEILERVLEAERPADRALVTAFAEDAVVVLDPWSGSSEVIRGSGEGYDYTLEGLGEGRYKLKATRSDEGAVVERIEGEGTLKELQKEYPFLKSVFAVHAVHTFPKTYRVDARRVTEAGQLRWAEPPSSVGLVVQTPPEELRFHLELPEGAGLIVERVAPGSRAEKLGLRRFDILVRLDDELIDSPRQLEKLAEGKGELEIIRRGEARKIDLAATR